jgi:hypothetical protein
MRKLCCVDVARLDAVADPPIRADSLIVGDGALVGRARTHAAFLGGDDGAGAVVGLAGSIWGSDAVGLSCLYPTRID